MSPKSNRGGEGRNTSSPAENRPGPARGQSPARSTHGIEPDLLGQDQPKDKSRARQTGTTDSLESAGEKAQRDAATEQTLSPGEPAGHE